MGCTCGASGAIDGHALTCALRTGEADVSYGDAMAAVAAEGGPQSAGLLADLMDRNARDIQWAQDRVNEGLERQRDEWRDRALDAEAELEAVRALFEAMLYPRRETVRQFRARAEERE